MTSPHLHIALAQAKIDDLRRTADAYRLAHDRAQAAAAHRSVTLRFGSAADERSLARLAELDGCALPAPPVLLAEVDGQLWAALAPTDGTVIANPFRPTAATVQLLLAHAAQLYGKPRRKRLLTRMRAARTAKLRRQTSPTPAHDALRQSSTQNGTNP